MVVSIFAFELNVFCYFGVRSNIASWVVLGSIGHLSDRCQFWGTFMGISSMRAKM